MIHTDFISQRLPDHCPTFKSRFRGRHPFIHGIPCRLVSPNLFGRQPPEGLLPRQKTVTPPASGLRNPTPLDCSDFHDLCPRSRVIPRSTPRHRGFLLIRYLSLRNAEEQRGVLTGGTLIKDIIIRFLRVLVQRRGASERSTNHHHPPFQRVSLARMVGTQRTYGTSLTRRT
jgi:hypothetical protein